MCTNGSRSAIVHAGEGAAHREALALEAAGGGGDGPDGAGSPAGSGASTGAGSWCRRSRRAWRGPFAAPDPGQDARYVCSNVVGPINYPAGGPAAPSARAGIDPLYPAGSWSVYESERCDRSQRPARLHPGGNDQEPHDARPHRHLPLLPSTSLLSSGATIALGTAPELVRRADLLEFDVVHQALRLQLRALVLALEGLDVTRPDGAEEIRRWFGSVLGVIRHHHHMEDDVIFPLMVAASPPPPTRTGP